MLTYIRTVLASHAADRFGDRGATAVEYGLMVAAIAAVIAAVVFGIGQLVSGAFDTTSTCIQNSGC
ncbi:MAG: Flp family type IVb pilin [Frankiaceae bacterium]